MLDLPKETGREYRPFDLYGWFMCFVGLIFMCHFGGIGWIFGEEKNWWWMGFTFLVFAEYVGRVAYGRVYKFVYYDTIIHPLYQITVTELDKVFYINAPSEEDLENYMYLHYPTLEYEVEETHTETFIRTERYL
jgi:hypothetical protein